MVIYAPSTEEKDPKKIIMSLQQVCAAASTSATNIATNTSNIASNTTNIAALQSPPLFRVALNTQQSIASSTLTRVNFDTTAFDNNSWWDGTNFAYKPQRAGYYRFSWSVYGGASGSLTRTLSRLRLNGSTDIVNGSDAPSSSGIGSSVGSDIIHLNGSTDSVTVVAFIVATTPIVGLTGSSFLTIFAGEFVGT